MSGFSDWLAREMPAGTVIGDPLWWAPRIERALANAQAQEIARLTAANAELERMLGESSEIGGRHFAELGDLRARLATIEAQASDATEYVLAQINKDLRARLADAERDAERYRWLREPVKSHVSGAETSRLMLHALHGGKFKSNRAALDAEIDAARGGAQREDTP